MNGTEIMKISSVICEYNPFHNGHEYMLRKMREGGATHIIACMSGNFTQRGTPAIYDKYTRTRAALAGGADLVAELPVSFACSGAERFASGGVSILNAFGCVDEIVFGSECGNTDILKKLAAAVEDREVSAEIQKYLSTGMTFAAARQKAVEAIYGSDTAEILSEPNNILGVEYIKALNRLGSNIIPSALLRKGADHDSEEIVDGYAGAKYIRSMIECGESTENLMPSYAAEIFGKAENRPPKGGRMSKLEVALMYRLRMMTEEKLAEIPEVGEGLENRIYSAARKGKSLEEIICGIKSKRYTRARIMRILMYALLGITKADMLPTPQYIRILGFNERGREILRAAKKTAVLPIVTKYSDVQRLNTEAQEMFSLESRCDDIYALSGETANICGRNMTEKMIYCGI